MDVKDSVRHSGWVNQKTVESVKSGTLPLRTVDCWFRSSREVSLDEVLPLVLVLESEGSACHQSNEHIVSVDT